MVAQRHQDRLKRLKDSVKHTHDYFSDCYKQFTFFQKFMFETTQSDEEIATNNALGKPNIEFNICHAYWCRLKGEFSKQLPSPILSSDDEFDPHPDLVEIMSGHMRHIVFDANKNGCQDATFGEETSAGFSAMKVFVEYANEMGFDPVIRFEKVFSPCLVGFDPLARLPSKSDGRYCFELFPKTREDFENEFPDVDISKLKFTKDNSGFSWSYKTAKDDEIILICDFYEKKKRKVKIVGVVGHGTMTADQYEQLKADWIKSGRIEQVPSIIKGQERTTEVTYICRYRFIEDQVLEYVETDFKSLPIIFFDGNSAYIENSNVVKQVIRPYVYDLVGIQKLKNFAGQTLANELENMTMAKLTIAKEAMPTEQSYLEAYTNPQKANLYVYQAYKDNDTNKPLPPPTTVMRTPIPPEITNTFTLTDQTSQTILGSYDAALGINDNQLSGRAMEIGAIQSNAAAKPYIVNYMLSFSQVLQVILELIPVVYVNKKSLPTIDMDGEKKNVPINNNGLKINYPSTALKVKVEAGSDFSVQKNQTLQTITQMSQASPIFAQFANAKCLDIIVDNLDCRGQEVMKERAKEFQQELKMQQQKAQEQGQNNNPMILKQQELQLKAQQMQSDNQIAAAKQQTEEQRVANEHMQIILRAQSEHGQNIAQIQKSLAEMARAHADLMLKHGDQAHRQAKETIEVGLAHDNQMHQQMMDHKNFAHQVKTSQQQPTGVNANG
jgi:hypothetical protein